MAMHDYIVRYDALDPANPSYRYETISAGSWLTARAKAQAGVRTGEACISVTIKSDDVDDEDMEDY